MSDFEGIDDVEADNRTGATGVETPLKRWRLPPAPTLRLSLVDVERLVAQLEHVCRHRHGLVWHAAGNTVVDVGIALDVAECDTEDIAAFVADAPRAIQALLIDLAALHAWAATATQTRMTRKVSK